MNEPELLEGISRAMATTVQSVGKLEKLLQELSRIGSHIEGVANRVNCMAMNVALEALRTEQSGATLLGVAEEAGRLEAHALTMLVEVTQRVEGLRHTIDFPVGISKCDGACAVQRNCGDR